MSKSKKSKKANPPAEALVEKLETSAETPVLDPVLDTVDPDFTETFAGEPTSEELAILDVTLPAEETAPVEEAQAIEAVEVPADAAPVPADQAPATVEDEVDFEQIVVAIEPEASKVMMDRMSDQIEARKALEIAKDSYNDNIQRTLKNVRATLVRDYAARVLIATRVEPTFLVSPSRDGEHYNVYAMGKLNDLVDGLCGLALKNAINIAIVKSMFALKKAGIAVTRDLAEAAASDKIRVTDKAVAALLSRHTVSHVTAPTQTSSTMRALETLGIVKATGSKNATVFEILDTPQTKALEACVERMAA